MSPERRVARLPPGEVAGKRYVAPFGPAPLGVGDWRIELAGDGWVELVGAAPHAFLGASQWVGRATLLTGDALGEARGGPVVLAIGGVD